MAFWELHSAIILISKSDHLILVDCSQPLTPRDGGVEFDCVYENCSAAFYCNKGYELSAESANGSICTQTGHWVPRTPLCEGKYNCFLSLDH